MVTFLIGKHLQIGGLQEIKKGVDSGEASAIEIPNLPSHLSDLPLIMSRLCTPVGNSNMTVVLVTILR